ncbi:CHASE domain-containing protein [Azohydromonas aeria]|uniref:CHASE domain-containing protein n=1 Tax=Azohydromonas aeria TaxID=2590212 RepID=UPI0012F740BF|nr:CHASE domain-containing protein [Azohydromonas aeria]
MTPPARPPGHKHLRGVVVSLWLLGLVSSALAGWWIQQHNQAVHGARLQALVDERVRSIQTRLLRYENGLRGTLGAVLVAGGEALTRRQFETYIKARDVAREFPGLRGFGFIRRVPPQRLADFLAAARGEGPESFSLREMAPHAGDHLVVQYLYPHPDDAAAWGLDIGGDADRRETALAAMRTAQVRMSAPLTLMQARQQANDAVLVMLPVYRTETDPGTAAARQAATVGWVYAVVTVSEALRDPGLALDEFAYALTDTVGGRFYASPGFAASPAADVPDAARRELTVHGRTWTLQAHALPGLTAADQLPNGRAVAGGLAALCTLLALGGNQLLRGRRRRLELLEHLEERVAGRTAELEHARRDLGNILDALPSLISYWDRDLVNRFANAAVRQWLGLEPDAPRRPHLREVLGDALYEKSLPHALAALRGEPQRFERSFPRPGGQGLRHSVSYYLPDVVDGEVRGFYSLVHDVTEIVESRRALDAERQRLDDILRDTNVATWEWNVQTGETRFNERWAQIIGWRLEELQPVSIDTWTRLFHPEDLKHSAELLERHFRGELDHYECEARLRHRDGHWVWVRDSGRVITWSEDGKPLWMHGIHQDIAKRKALEEALHERTRQAEAASLAKSAFLANMSHEIRTPMNAILGLTHLLASEGATPRQAGQLAKVEDAARHLLSIINDILDLSKIEAGKVRLEERNFSLPALLEQVRSIVGTSAAAKGLRFEVDAGEVPAWLVGDDTRLRQALLNYAGNAVKFTEAGSIRLRAQQQRHRQGQWLLVRFSVEDTGVGIRPEQVPRLFQAFEQAEASTTREHGGTGLGLAITRRLAELMGGSAGAQPRQGGGSVFWFTAWLQRGTAAGQPAPALAQADALPWLRRRGARVLLAEDNAVNREIALVLLRNAGLEVDVAENGQQALERLQQRHCDLVLMDMQMPVMDGLQATHALRALPGFERLPVLALTANAFDEDRAACLAAGMNDFVSKPVEPLALYATLAKWLSSSADAGGPQAAPGTDDPAPAA